ncbi:MAG: hypothetical protein LQ348_005111 [Seirophora lacunosa]|nr:MAG: hypothetical protein LQ348_005111 [Seirophora lacunosa]
MPDTVSHQMTLITGPLVKSSKEPGKFYTVVQKIAAASHKINVNRELASNTLTEVDITYPILQIFAEEDHNRITFISGGIIYNVLHELAEAYKQTTCDPFSYTLTEADIFYKVLHKLAEAYNQKIFNRDPSSHTSTEANILYHVVQELQAPSHQIASDWGPPSNILTEADILYVVLLRGANSSKRRNPFSYILDRVTSLHALLHPANSSTRLSAKKRMTLRQRRQQPDGRVRTVLVQDQRSRRALQQNEGRHRKAQELRKTTGGKNHALRSTQIDEVIWLPRFHMEQLKAAYTAHRKAMKREYAALMDTLKGKVRHRPSQEICLPLPQRRGLLEVLEKPSPTLKRRCRSTESVGTLGMTTKPLRCSAARWSSRKENPEWAGTGSREKGPRVLSHEEALEMKAQVLERKVMLERKGKFWKPDIKGASERWSNTNPKPGEEKE